MKKLISIGMALFFCFALSLNAFADAFIPPSPDFSDLPLTVIVAIVAGIAAIVAGIVFLVVLTKRR